MDINELESYRLSDAIRFHDRLNPRLWDEHEQLRPEVREKLLAIAADFQESLGVTDLDVEDITISGSNAAYTYTPHSDIDLHLVVKMPEQCDDVYQELFNAKKYQYNDEHDIRIRGADVELYVQPSNEPVVSLGEYSILNDKWIQVPRRRRADINHNLTQHKYQDLRTRIEHALEEDDADRISALIAKIKDMRKTGLAKNGEFGPENLVFKMLRTQGLIKKLYDARAAAQDRAMSLAEKKKEPVRYGFASRVREDDTGQAQGSSDGDAGAQSTWDGVSPDTQEFLNEDDRDEKILKQFIQHTAQRLGIESMPHIHIHTDPDWSTSNHSFGRYDPETHDLHVSLPGRHLLDVLRTTAHELTHCRQHEVQPLDGNAGETGSPWENEAHAQAGIIMRDFADAHPEYFEKGINEGLDQIPRITRNAIAAACMAVGAAGCATTAEGLGTVRDVARLARQIESTSRSGMQEELAQELKNYARARGGDANAQNQSILYRKERELREASGYIPTDAQKNDPRFVMALTQDVRPGETGRQANKLRLETDAQGRPALLRENEQLDEIRMNPTSLRREAANTGAQAGMEFEMYVPNVAGGDDDDLQFEPDYDQDERARDFDTIFDFFYDGDWNSRGDVNHMIDRMRDDYMDSRYEAMNAAWENQQHDLILDAIKDEIPEPDLIYEMLSDEHGHDRATEILAAAKTAPDFSSAREQRAYAQQNPLYADYFEALDRVDEEYRDRVERAIDRQNDEYEKAFEEFQDDWDDYSEEDWLREAGIRTMADVESNYDIAWPHYREPGGGELDIQDVANDFGGAINRETIAASDYHRGRRGRDNYVVEPDGSLNDTREDTDRGLEFISPPMPVDQMIQELNQVVEWAKERGCYTNKSTGLHINVSVPGLETDELDYVKLALLLGDEYVLKQFGREANTYAKSALSNIRERVQGKGADAVAEYFDKMRQGLAARASRAIHSPSTSKYTSINVKDGYIEFRSPGGDWLNEDLAKIENTLLRFVVALSAAADPTKYREEYLKKLYSILSPKGSALGEQDPITVFARYSAGELPRSALKGFIRGIQQTRQMKKMPPVAAPRNWEATQGATRDWTTMSNVAQDHVVNRDIVPQEPLWWVQHRGTGEDVRVNAPNAGRALALAMRQRQDWHDASVIGDLSVDDFTVRELPDIF